MLNSPSNSEDFQSSAAFISWTHFHGRSEGLARELGISEFTQRGGEGPAWRRYIRLWKMTGAYLKAKQPKAIIIMQPPVVALFAAKWHMRGKNCRFAGDLHTAVFDHPKWTWATGLTLRLLRGKNLAIVTNDALAGVAAKYGARSLVMHDLIEEYPDHSNEAFDDEDLRNLVGQRFALVPVAYSYDEPLEALQEATRMTPDITWVFTGKAPEEYRAAAPKNVVFSGFASRDDYLRLLSHCGVVIAATTSENTMQRAGYEALCASKPLVTTNMRVLEEYFGDSSIRTEPTAVGFAEAVRDTLQEYPRFQQSMEARRAIKLEEQTIALSSLREWLSE
jgi:hypothetical protein